MTPPTRLVSSMASTDVRVRCAVFQSPSSAAGVPAMPPMRSPATRPATTPPWSAPAHAANEKMASCACARGVGLGWAAVHGRLPYAQVLSRRCSGLWGAGARPSGHERPSSRLSGTPQAREAASGDGESLFCCSG